MQPSRLAKHPRPRLRKFILIATAILICGFVERASTAEKPSLTHLHPVAVAPGATNTINLSGKFEPWPPKLWSTAQDLDFAFGTNKNSVTITVKADAKPGAHLVRAYNADGASEPALLVIHDGPVLGDIEPNNEFVTPQLLTNFPAALSGRLDKNGDVDSFGFSVKAGQWIDARLESHTLKSGIDAVLRLTTTNGYQLAWNHDFATFDPRLVWRAPRDQSLVLQVFGFQYPADAQIQLSGGNDGIYFLKLSLSDYPPADLNVALNNEDAPIEKLPVELHGAICPAGDDDTFSIELDKDDAIEARVIASEFGSPLDPWLEVRGEDGKQLARNDDAEGLRDATLQWKAPAKGKYIFAIGSLTHRGEENWRYRLRVAKPNPDFEVKIAASEHTIESDSTNELKITAARLHGFTNELLVKIEGLPPGVEAEPVKLAAKDKEASLKLVAKDAAAFNGPVKILVTDTTTNHEKPALFDLVSRSVNNGVPGGHSKLLVETLAEIWLTVKPPQEKPAAK